MNKNGPVPLIFGVDHSDRKRADGLTVRDLHRGGIPSSRGYATQAHFIFSNTLQRLEKENGIIAGGSWFLVSSLYMDPPALYTHDY